MRYNEILITSRHNPLICEVAALQKKRERDDSGRFLIDGAKLTFEYIRHIGAPAYLFICESYREKYENVLLTIEQEMSLSLFATLVSESAFAKLTDQKAPDGIIAVGEFSALDYAYIRESDSVDFGYERIIALSSLRDNGNVGTVIRTALALGYDRVLLSSDCADVLSPKTLRATMGAAFAMKIGVCEQLSVTLGSLCDNGRRVYCAELRENASPLQSVALSAEDIFVVGNEGHGIDPLVSNVSTGSVYIPISDRSESLNAAVAASLLMWHQHTNTF